MDVDALARRYEKVKSALPANVVLVAVSKKRTVEEIQALYDLGHRDFGENYPQELRDKQPRLPADIRWHFIGHLQSNKVKYIVPFVHLVHGVDSTGLLRELDKRAKNAGRRIDVLLQAHIAQEQTKHGFAPEEIGPLLAEGPARHWPNLRIRGLMGMATDTEDNAQILAEFTGLAELYRRMALTGAAWISDFSILSMGMSGDMGLALEAGSNMVRVGTSIFGPRAY